MSNKKFSLATLVFLVVANMIGAGVFTTSGFALQDLGSANRVLFAWLLGGLIALCGAVSYGLLAKHITESGGEYTYLKRNIHPSIGFVAGILSLVVGFSGAAAFAAMTLEVYVGIHPDTLQGGVIASIVVIICWLAHAFHIRTGSWLQNTIVVIKLIALLFFIICAIRFMPATPLLHTSQQHFSLLALATTLMWVSFSYSGFNAAIYVAEEASQPAINIPRALVIGTLIATAIYLALNAAFIYIPPFGLVSGHADIAAKAAQYIGGTALATIIRVIIVISLFTSLSSLFMVGPRVYVKMAEDGMLPRLFQAHGKAPLLAATLQALLVLAMVWFTQLAELLSYLGITLSISTVLTVATVFKCYQPTNTRTRLILIIPTLFIALTSVFVILACFNNPTACIASLTTLLLGILLYLVFGRYQRKSLKPPSH